MPEFVQERGSALDIGQYVPCQGLTPFSFSISPGAKCWRLRIDTIRSQFPDCFAYKKTQDGEKLIRIEFEWKSRIGDRLFIVVFLILSMLETKNRIQ